MKYVSLLRGINVGGNKKVDMKKVRTLLENAGYANVATYINSGNIFFTSGKNKSAVSREIGKLLKKEFGFEVQTLVKTRREIQKIAKAIPKQWQNDSEQRTDVAYLFPEIDSKKSADFLPVNKKFVDVRYVKGALIWNFSRADYNHSKLNKLIGHKLYKQMTIRNVNTARYLAE